LQLSSTGRSRNFHSKFKNSGWKISAYKCPPRSRYIDEDGGNLHNHERRPSYCAYRLNTRSVEASQHLIQWTVLDAGSSETTGKKLFLLQCQYDGCKYSCRGEFKVRCDCLLIIPLHRSMIYTNTIVRLKAYLR
jgi:hypothetical protein